MFYLLFSHLIYAFVPRSGNLLLDYLPLKSHQHQFDVEVPWKDVEVIIQSGSFNLSIGVVKDVRRDFRGSLRILLWIAQHNCSIEIDHLAVVERRYVSFVHSFWSNNIPRTLKPLLEYLPLQAHQLTRFSPNASFEAMRTGPVPWAGLMVDFVKGEYKGQRGVVRDVNRYTMDPFNSTRRSGLTLSVERYTFSSNSSNQIVKVDYDAVRYHRCVFFVQTVRRLVDYFSRTTHVLCDIFMPTAKQTFYIPNTVYDQCLPEASASSESIPISSTPMPSYSERETIFTGIWNPDYVYPDPLESPLSPDPIRALPLWPDQSPRASSSLPEQSPRASSPLHEQPLPHWILHPKLLGIPIQVDIIGGELDTSMKKGGIFVKTINSVNGINVVCQHFGQTISVPYTSVVSFHERPKPATEKALMVVARGRLEHIGKFVRQIHHFYENEKTEKNHMLEVVTMDRSQPRENTALEFLDMHPMELEYVQETAEERRYSKVLLQMTRLERKFEPVIVRCRDIYDDLCTVVE